MLACKPLFSLRALSSAVAGRARKPPPPPPQPSTSSSAKAKENEEKQAPIVARMHIPTLRPNHPRTKQPIICISMNQGLDFIPRVEAMVRMNATLPDVNIGEMLDFMELKREANGKFIWFMRLRVDQDKFPYLLCHRPLRGTTANNTDSKMVFNPISWSAFGAPLRFLDKRRPGIDMPNFSDPNAVNALTSPVEILAALEHGKIPFPHRRTHWEAIDFTLLESPTQVSVRVQDAQQFMNELRQYLDLPISVVEKATEFGLSNSGRVVLEFACPSEALLVYDVLHAKRMVPYIKVFHSGSEVDDVIRSEYSRLTEKYVQAKRNQVKCTFESRLDEYDSDTLVDYDKLLLVEEEQEPTPEEVYGRFVIDSQIAMSTDPTISRVEINSLQVATTRCLFNMKDSELHRQNKLYSGSLQKMLEPVREPVMPQVLIDDSFFKLPI
ncbi:hypothetical protein BASA81_010029 [Batrachochytrium salamandrivorans]|nr:hypothetical protein BASA81_010029 [Batrachochytrium salamandrivorans]